MINIIEAEVEDEEDREVDGEVEEGGTTAAQRQRRILHAKESGQL